MRRARRLRRGQASLCFGVPAGDFRRRLPHAFAVVNLVRGFSAADRYEQSADHGIVFQVRRSEDFKGSKEPLKTNDEAASLLNVSTSSVKRAATVLENGTPAVQKAVKAGQVTVTDAAAVVSEPAKVQNAAVKAVCDGEAKTLREAVELNGKPEEGPPAPKDSEGHEVPQATADVFANVEKFDALVSLCRQLQKGIDELVRLPGGEQLRMQTKPTGSADKQIFKTEELESLKRHLKFTRPHSICPYCAGQAKAGCRCSGRGWIDSVAWKNVEATDKAKLEVVA